VSVWLTQTEYEAWILANDTLSEAGRDAMRADIGRLAARPVFSILMPAFETPPEVLRAAIDSVTSQLYPFWELCVADDASRSPAVLDIVSRAAAADPRVRWVRRQENGHIAAATNSALALATGEFVALMDHDDLLAEHALYAMAGAIAAHPDADVLYSDEDCIDASGRRSDPYFKPMWSPELLCGHNMISHLGVYRRSLVLSLGGLRTGYEGSQDWDLALRATSATTPDKVRHVPGVLYHWRRQGAAASFSEGALARCTEAGRRAVEDWLQAEGAAGACVEPARLAPFWTRVRYALPSPRPVVEVVMAALHQGPVLQAACDGVLEMTDWPASRFSLAVVACGCATRDPLPPRDRLRIVHAPAGCGTGAALNAGVSGAGDVLVFLSSDIEVVDADWLAELVRLAMRPAVGIAGPKLVYADGKVAQAGAPADGSGDPALPAPAPFADAGYYGQFALTRSVASLAGGCLAMRRSVFEEAGGFDTGLLEAFHETDLCLRVRDLGYRVVWSADALLAHQATGTDALASRWQAGGPAGADRAAMRRKWDRALFDEPYVHPQRRICRRAG
jgi:GT2 family glycosyltransferase